MQDISLNHYYQVCLNYIPDNLKRVERGFSLLQRRALWEQESCFGDYQYLAQLLAHSKRQITVW